MGVHFRVLFSGLWLHSAKVFHSELHRNKKIKMSTAAFDMGPAGRVSPLIKLTRWTLLIGGIYWGSKRYYALKEIEDNRRAYEAKMAPVWAAEDAAAKAAADKQGMADLAKMAGVPGY